MIYCPIASTYEWVHNETTYWSNLTFQYTESFFTISMTSLLQTWNKYLISSAQLTDSKGYTPFDISW